MDLLDPAISTVLLIAVVLGIYLPLDLVRRGADDLYAFQTRRRRRLAGVGLALPIVNRQLRLHHQEGPGRYLVRGVVGRTGDQTSFQLEARGVLDAVYKALERGVSPSSATKLCEH